MKNLLLLAFFIFVSWQATSQTSSKNNVGTIKLRNAGAIMQNGVVKGYYNFYDLEKADRKNNNYSLAITDENLREINAITITRPNSYLLMDAVFNGTSFGFLFFDSNGDKLELIAYDQTLKEQGKIQKTLKNKFGKAPFMFVAQGNESLQAFLVGIPNKGFVYYGIKDESKSDFEIECYDNRMKRVWAKYGPEDKYDFENAIEAYQSEQYVGSIIARRTAMLDMDAEIDLQVQDASDGKILFRMPMASAKYKLALADLSFDVAKGQFVMFGEYFGKDANVLKDASLGFATWLIDMTGKIVSEKVNSWSELGSKVAVKDKSKFESKSILFHDFVRSADGDFFAIGEQYSKSGTPLSTKLNIYDLLIIQFDANFAVKQVHLFEKDKNSFSMKGGVMIGGSKMLSYIAKAYGGFDFVFTQQAPDKNTFVVNYINYDREKGQKGKNQLGSIVYTPEKTFTLDKMDLVRQSARYFVYRAKPGYVMISEYHEKEKRIDNRLEKINF